MPAALANLNVSTVPYAPFTHSWVSEIGSNIVFASFAPPRPRPASLRSASKGIGADAPEWRKVARERLANICRYQDGWDGVGSKGISEELTSKADRVLEIAFNGVPFPAPPSAAPCADGSLLLDWWLVDTRFELMIEPNGALEAWALDRGTGHEASADGPAAIDLLRKWAGRLTADKLLPSA